MKIYFLVSPFSGKGEIRPTPRNQEVLWLKILIHFIILSFIAGGSPLQAQTTSTIPSTTSTTPSTTSTTPSTAPPTLSTAPPTLLTAPTILSLEAARRLAATHNRDLRTLRLNLNIALEKTREARSRAFPQVSSSLQYLIDDKPKQASNDGEFTEASISLEQTLFHLGIWAGIRAAKNYQQAEELATARFEQTLDYMVTESYLGILRLEKKISVLRELEENTKEHLRKAQNFYQEGILPKTDLLKTELALCQVQRDLLAGENEEKKFWTIFKILLGIEITKAYQLQEVELASWSNQDMAELQKKALFDRQDLKKLSTEKSFLTEIRKAYQAKRYPNLSAFGSWNYTSNDLEPRDQNVTGGVRLTMPIFTGFSISAQIAQANNQLAQNQIQVEDLTTQIQQEVEIACLDLQETKINIETSQKEVTQAEENLRITKDLFKESMATTTDVLDAQTLLAQAKNHLFNGRYDQLLASQRLKLAIGSSLDIFPK